MTFCENCRKPIRNQPLRTYKGDFCSTACIHESQGWPDCCESGPGHEEHPRCPLCIDALSTTRVMLVYFDFTLPNGDNFILVEVQKGKYKWGKLSLAIHGLIKALSGKPRKRPFWNVDAFISKDEELSAWDSKKGHSRYRWAEDKLIEVDD